MSISGLLRSEKEIYAYSGGREKNSYFVGVILEDCKGEERRRYDYYNGIHMERVIDYWALVRVVSGKDSIPSREFKFSFPEQDTGFLTTTIVYLEDCEYPIVAMFGKLVNLNIRHSSYCTIFKIGNYIRVRGYVTGGIEPKTWLCVQDSDSVKCEFSFEEWYDCMLSVMNEIQIPRDLLLSYKGFSLTCNPKLVDADIAMSVPSLYSYVYRTEIVAELNKRCRVGELVAAEAADSAIKKLDRLIANFQRSEGRIDEEK